MVVPQYKRPEQSRAIDSTTIFIVEYREKPVFFLEIKPSMHLQQPSLRRHENNQVRGRASDIIVDGLLISTVYGVSAIGDWDVFLHIGPGDLLVLLSQLPFTISKVRTT